MQKIATRVFVGASILFGISGILAVVFVDTDFFARLTGAFGFVVLSSFAVAVAGKYLQ